MDLARSCYCYATQTEIFFFYGAEQEKSTVLPVHVDVQIALSCNMRWWNKERMFENLFNTILNKPELNNYNRRTI